MRNRAKCKLCGDILESFHSHDFVTCKCGEISIDGGKDGFRTGAKDYANFLRLDDNDAIVRVTFLQKTDQEEKETLPPQPSQVLDINQDHPLPTDSKDELIKIVDEMIINIERLPQNAQGMPLNHYDMMSILLLFKRFLKD